MVASWGGELPTIFDEGVFGIAGEPAASEKRMRLVAGGAAQQHQFGAMMGECQVLDVSQQKTTHAATTPCLCDDDVLDDAEGLGAIHRVRTQREEDRAGYDSLGLGDEKKAGRRFGKRGDLLRQNPSEPVKTNSR